MSKYQVVMSSGPDNPNRATRAMMIACRVVEEGHELSVFLVDDAVYLANLELAGNLRAATGDTLMQYLQVLLDKKIPVNVCLPCAKSRNLDAATFPENWVLEKGVEVVRLNEKGYTTWFF